jgi:hypothetical protein
MDRNDEQGARHADAVLLFELTCLLFRFGYVFMYVVLRTRPRLTGIRAKHVRTPEPCTHSLGKIAVVNAARARCSPLAHCAPPAQCKSPISPTILSAHILVPIATPRVH